ncbi:hypothetical protein HYX14_02780 [Candidatus Woesearchaeota archaeon]|nr:hypothetical protein [Candidatus Woesearchaeota archaeon]
MGLHNLLWDELLAVSEQVSNHLEMLQQPPPLHSPSPAPATSLPLVVLLHGYLVGSPSLRGMSRYLAKNGFTAIREKYPFWQDLEKSEEQLRERMEEHCQRVGRKVDIIGHSQGGLLGFGVARRHPDLVERVVALGAPFRGTYTAYLHYPVPSARQMVPGSSYLQELAERDFPEEVQFYSVYSPLDPVVFPPWNAKLPEAKNVHTIPVRNVSHGGLTRKRCYGLLVELLRGR